MAASNNKQPSLRFASDFVSDEELAHVMRQLLQQNIAETNGAHGSTQSRTTSVSEHPRESSHRPLSTLQRCLNTLEDLMTTRTQSTQTESQETKTTVTPLMELWLEELRQKYSEIKEMEAHYTSCLRTLNSAPGPYKPQCMIISTEMKQQLVELRQSKRKVKEIIDPVFATGQSKVLGRSGLQSKSFLESGMQLATLVGMANPAPAEGQTVSEEIKPPGEATLDAPTTVIETVASSVELAGPVVQDTISAEFELQKMMSGQDGYQAEVQEWNYDTLVSRPTIVRTWNWDSTQGTGVEIGKFYVPDVFKNPESITTSVFKQYSLVRWKYIGFHAHLNTNQFMMGRACLASIPTEYYADGSSNYNRAITSNRVDLNASVMSQGSLIVPWIWNEPWMDTIRPTTNGFALRNSFTVAMYVILPLKGTENDQPSIPVRITMTIHGLELACPIAPFATPFDQYWTAVAYATGQAGDEMNDNASVVYYPRSNAYANYEPGTKALVNVIGGSEPTMSTQTAEDPMDLKMILEKPGIEAYFSWSTSQQPGTILHTQRVTPVLQEDVSFPTTPIAYFSRFAAFWRGRIRYRLDFAKSIFHTGKLCVVFVPIGATITADNYLAFNHIIIDLKEDGSFDFDAAFYSNGILLYVHQLESGENVESTSRVNVHIVAHTKLQTNSTMQSTIDCALWKSAGPGFQLYNIREPGNQARNVFTFAGTTGATQNVQIAPQPGSGNNPFFRLGSGQYVTPTTVPDGLYTLDTPITIGFTSEQGNFTWTGTILYCVGGWVMNSTAWTGSWINATLDTTFSATMRAGTFARGQTGNLTAMHDKSEDSTPLLGYDNQSFDPIANFEPITSLLQILERPHRVTPDPTTYKRYLFNNRTNELVDSFEMFSNCFTFTTGYVQWMVVGGDVVIDSTNGRVSAFTDPNNVSYLYGGVSVPSEAGHVLLFDAPPTHLPLLCSNLKTPQQESTLSTVAIKFKSGLDVNDVSLHVRAGEKFSYHVWAGVPTPTEQRHTMKMTPRKTTGTKFHKKTLDTLREKMRAMAPLPDFSRGEPEFATGQCDEEPTGQPTSPNRKKRSVSKKIAKFFSQSPASSSSSIPPTTETQVRTERSTNPFEDDEDEEEDADQFQNCKSSDESSDSFEVLPKLSKSAFIPKPVHETLERASSALGKVDQYGARLTKSVESIAGIIEGEGRDWLRTTKTEITGASSKLQEASRRVQSFARKGEEVINSTRDTLEEHLGYAKESVEENGLFGFLFGGDTERSKLIQILLVDALECVTIRSKIKWFGMLVKLGISFGLTKKLVHMIVTFAKRQTGMTAPTERQQGFATGQAVEDYLPFMASLVSVIVMFASFALSGGMNVNKKKTETMWDWISERARQVNSVDRGMESMFKLFDKINGWVIKCIVKFFPLDSKTHAALSEREFLKLGQKVIEKAAPLMKVKVLVRIFADAELRASVATIDDDYAKFLEFSADPDISRKHGQIFNRVNFIMKELRARIISLVDSSSVRIDPYHMSFYGPSGAGKSYLASCVAYVLGRSQGVPLEDLYYPRTPNQEFWDNYRCQEFVGIDDVDQQDNEDMAGDMITLKSNVPKVLPMAHLETKGCVFSSRGLITTTNVAYPEPTSIKSKVAYKRRRNKLIEVMVVSEQRQTDHSHLSFTFRDPVKSTAPPIGEKMSFPELMLKLAIDYSNYLAGQHRLVAAVAPETKFKKLYVYNDSEESAMKIYNIIVELLTRDVNHVDPSIRPLAELDIPNAEFHYPPVDKDRADPENFRWTLQTNPPEPLNVETEDEDDEEVVMRGELIDEDDYAVGNAGEDELSAQQAAKERAALRELTGEVDTPEDTSSESSEEEEDEVRVCDNIPPFVRRFAYADAAIEPPTITEEFCDLLYVLSDKRYGRKIHEDDFVWENDMQFPGSGETFDAMQKLRLHLRKVRNWNTLNNMDDYWDDLGMSRDGLRYYSQKFNNTPSRAKATLYGAYCAFFSLRFVSVVSKMVGCVLKTGYLSTMIRNFNNRMLPDGPITGLQAEVYRTVTEGVLTPWCVMQRVFAEARRFLMTALDYVTEVISTCVSKKASPELHQLIKIGCFLIGGYLIYQGWKWLRNSKDDKDSVAVAYLKGEVDEESNLTLPILGKNHAGIPEDGHSYRHHHQCERCRLIFSHTHAVTAKSKTYKLLCKKCGGKERTMRAENNRSELEDEDDVELFDAGVGEVVVSSGGTAKERFRKRAQIKKSKNTKPLKRVAVGESWFSKMFPKFKKEDVEEALATGESSDDPQFLSVKPIIKNNLVSFHLGNRKVNGIMLKKKWMVTVAHMFYGISTKELAYSVNWKGQFYHGNLATAKDIRFDDDVEIGGKHYTKELAYVNLRRNKTLPAFRDITSHIPANEDMADLICGQEVVVLVKEREGRDIETIDGGRVHVAVDRRVKTTFQTGTSITAVETAWMYTADLENGACGSAVVCRNPALQTKLIGFHFSSYDGTRLAMAFPLWRDDVDRMTQDEDDIGVGECEVAEIESMCEEVYNEFPEHLPEDHKLHLVPEGRVLIVGKLKKEWQTSLPRKTDIVPSPFYDQIYRHTTEPAILNDYDPRSPGDIIQRGINKFGKVHPNKRPRPIMNMVIQHKVKQHLKLCKQTAVPLRTLTQHEAINGIAGQPYMPGIRMDTSPGFPYVRMRPAGAKGRNFLFEQIEDRMDGAPQYKPGKLLQDDLDYIWNGLKEGKIRKNYYLDTLKDERRSHHRLYKTRFFNVHNVAWLIIHRRLFLPLQAFRMEKNFALGSALGLDMHGTDPTRLVNWWHDKGTKFLASDFAEWDGNVPAEDIADKFEVDIRLMRVFDRMYQKKQPNYGMETPEQLVRMREVVSTAANDRICIVADTVYRATQGVPSGRGDTSDTNTGVHDMSNYANFIELFLAAGEQEKATCDYKDEETAEVAVGDDGGGVTSDDIAHIYNNLNIAAIFKHYGYNCTPPTKDDSELMPWVDIEDFSFLKCSFRRDEEHSRLWHMCMAPKVIYELTNWTTIHGDPYELFYSNMDDALRFSVHHGPDFFNDFRDRVNDVLEKSSQPPLAQEYQDEYDSWIDRFNLI